MRTYGPSAAALAGTSEMSGLPAPWPPAGIGYSYLDWFGAYNMANAMLAALYRQRVTGEGCYIDSSQVETGIYLTGSAVLDFAINGRKYERSGNRSPYKPAAPHGAYRTAGADRWIAIACFDEAQWTSLTDTLKADSLRRDPRFISLAARCQNQDALDAEIGALTQAWEGRALMQALQMGGVAAGICQTAEDRCEHDPQLRHLQWQVDLSQRDLGVWPVKVVPGKLSRTPSHIGGARGRSGPSYGQDNDYVFRELLGLSAAELEALVADGVI
jgi:crotonobetainyl-CoA:carnitine CoA-transferase CaiB-like acyl-CoA transferase